jgi:phosphoglycerate dehydrogenase-like enzyme
VTGDLRPAGGPAELDRLGFDLLRRATAVDWRLLEQSAGVLDAEHATRHDAIMLLKPRITRASLADAERLCLVARYGVGYDNIDIPSCTEAGVMVTITPDGVRRPVASGALAHLLALAHRLPEKDRFVRQGRWGNRLDSLGAGLTGRVLGLLGLGGIGREIVDLARAFGLTFIAYDPYLPPDVAQRAGVRPVDLETLFREADFVCVTCALTPQTRHLVDAERLALMKPTAYLVNVARGAIVDQAALTESLRTRAISGAALDVFEQEPLGDDDPLLGLDNVILSPHSISWVEELARGNMTSACRAVLDVVAGRVPGNLVNPEVLETAALRDKLARLPTTTS